MLWPDDNAAKPFALFLSWHPPHNWDGEFGYNAPADLLKLYDPAKLTLRPNVEDTPQIRKMYQGRMAMCTSVVREKLHAQTLAWMAKFGDKGMAYKELMARVMVKEDVRHGLHGAMTSGSSGQGRLKGRPEDVLAGKIK